MDYEILHLADQNLHLDPIFKKVSTRYELANGTKLYGKQILSDPEKYFTEDIMTYLDSYCQTKFLYGGGTEESEPENIETGEKNG